MQVLDNNEAGFFFVSVCWYDRHFYRRGGEDTARAAASSTQKEGPQSRLYDRYGVLQHRVHNLLNICVT